MFYFFRCVFHIDLTVDFGVLPTRDAATKQGRKAESDFSMLEGVAGAFGKDLNSGHLYYLDANGKKVLLSVLQVIIASSPLRSLALDIMKVAHQKVAVVIDNVARPHSANPS